jgi:hypothetical protein
MPEPAGEHLAVVGQDLLRHPVPAHRRGQPVTDGLGPLPRHQPCADTEPGVIIQPGQCLGRGPVGQADPAHEVHLPQLHRRAALPALPRLPPPAVATGLDQTGPGQRPIHTGHTRHRRHPAAVQLDHDPPRPPRRMQPPQLEHRRLDQRRHLMRTRPRPVRPIRQPRQTVGLIPADPGMQRLPGHAPLLRRSGHVMPIGDHRQHRPIALLGHAHLPHRGSVKDQPK